MTRSVSIFAIQLLGITILFYGLGGILIDMFKAKGRALLSVLTGSLSDNLTTLGALFALNAALNIEQGLSPFSSVLLGDSGGAYFIVLLPVVLAGVSGLSLSHSVAEFRNS